MNWPIKKLGDVLQISRGGSPRPIENYITEDKDGLNWIKIGDVQVGAKYITHTKEKIRKEGLAKTREVKSGDFLLSNSMSFGRPYITQIDGCIHDGWLALRDEKKIFDTDFLYHVLNSNAVKEQFIKYASGAVVKNLNIDAVSKVVVAIPPLAEQQRIAELLDTADHILKQRESAIAKLEDLEQSIFVELFNTSDANEISIADMLIKKILLLHKDGNHGSYYPKSDQFGDVGIPFLTAKCISESGQINDKSIELLNNESASKLTIGWIEDGDVLLAHNASVGKVALYEGIYEKALIGTSLTAFRPNQKYLTSDYLYAALRSTKFQSQLTKNMGQTTRNQVPITAQRRLSFCIPSVELQIKFSERMKIIRIQRLDQIRAASKNIQLVSSLQHQSFAVN